MLREYFGRSAHDLQQQKLEDELRTFILNLHNVRQFVTFKSDQQQLVT